MVLLMCICILCFIFGDKGLTNADHNIVLQVTTSDKCVDGSYRMVNNRDFYLLCYYNHTMDALETALFRRGSDLILSHPGNLTSLFADRGEQSITDYVATVQIKANFSSGDVSNYSCAAGVNSIVPSFPSIVDPTSNSVASVDEAVIRGLIKNAESETIFNEPYTKTVTAETGTGDYYCLPPTLSVEDESGSVCTETRTSTKSTCEFEVTCPPEGLKSYTAFATLYGVSTNKTFHMTCGAPSTPSTRAANTINSGLWAGISAAGSVLVIIFSVALIFCCKKKSEGSYIVLTKEPEGPVDVDTEVTIICKTYGISKDENLVLKMLPNGTKESNASDIQQKGDMLILLANKILKKKIAGCFIRYNNSFLGDDITVDVKGIVLTQSPPGPVIENTPVTFTCVATNIEPSHHLEWTVGGKIVHCADKGGEKRSTYPLTADKNFNGKEVQCYVKENPSLKDTMTLDVRDVVLTQYPPGPVFKNTEVTFTCEAAVQASHKLMWTVGGTQTDATREEMINYKRGKRSVLVLPITKELNGKTVECYVKDSDSPSKTSVNKTLDVKECGVRLIQNPPGPVLEDTDVTFICETSNVALPANVIWKFGYKKGNNVTPTSLTLPSSEKGGALIFPASKSMNNNQVQCYARNNPAVAATVTIDVNRKKNDKSKRKSEGNIRTTVIDMEQPGQQTP